MGPGLQFKIPFGIDSSYNVQTQTVQTLSFGYRATQSGYLYGSSTSYNYSSYMSESTMLTGDLNIVDISAEKVLTLMPDIKKEMPIMNSFSGNLDMEVAATTEIDTTMNLVLPTLDGIMRFTGS